MNADLRTFVRDGLARGLTLAQLRTALREAVNGLMTGTIVTAPASANSRATSPMRRTFSRRMRCSRRALPDEYRRARHARGRDSRD